MTEREHVSRDVVGRAPADVMVALLDDSVPRGGPRRWLQRLRRSGVARRRLSRDAGKLDKQLKYAASRQVSPAWRSSVPTSWRRGEVALRDLTTRAQQPVARRRRGCHRHALRREQASATEIDPKLM